MSHRWSFYRIPQNRIDLFGHCSEEQADEIVSELLDLDDADFTLEDSRKDLDEEDRSTWDSANAMKTCLLHGLSYNHFRSKSKKEGLDHAIACLYDLESFDPEPLAEETTIDPVCIQVMLPDIPRPQPRILSMFSEEGKNDKAIALKKALELGLRYVAILVGDGKRFDEDVYGIQTTLLRPEEIQELCKELGRLVALREDVDPAILEVIREHMIPSFREVDEDGDWLWGFVG